jgi:hypothetical protein
VGQRGNSKSSGLGLFLRESKRKSSVGNRLFYVHYWIVSAVKRVEFVICRVSYIVLRGRWWNIIVLNANAKSEHKSDDLKNNLTRKWSKFFIIFPGFIWKFYHVILMQKWGERLSSNRQLGMSAYIRISDDGIRIVNLSTSKKVVVNSTMFPHWNIHKYTWTSPDGQTNIQIDYILIDWKWHWTF